MSQFSVGDRVQVTDDWFVTAHRGAIGTIIDAHKGVPDKREEGVYWVAFESPVDVRENGGFTDSAEIDADCLRPI